MKRTTLILAAIVMFQLVHTSVSAQLTSQQIDSLAEKALHDFGVAGLAVAVVKDGKIIHEKGYGVSSVVTKQPVDAHTNFQIASNTKAFTTAALSILVDEGKIAWTDKVRKYIPEFKMYDDYVTEHFTIEDLLCHRSGLGLGAGDLMIFPDGTDFTIHDVLTSFQYFKPQSDFRTKFDYDNQLYYVAGELIKRVSGLEWDQFVQTRILDALQMTRSYATVGGIKDRSNLATPHFTGTGTIKPIPMMVLTDHLNGAAGSIVSNVDDMSKWMMMQLNKGKYGSNPEKQLFSPARQKEMWNIHTVTPPDFPVVRYNIHFSGYGLGWSMYDMKGNLNVSHTGGMPGMLSSVLMIPDLKLGIVILTNTDAGGFWAFVSINQTIIDSYLGLKSIQWTDLLKKQFEAEKVSADTVTIKAWEVVTANKNIKVNTANYTGTYQDKWFGKVEVFLKDGQLWFKSLRSPKLNGPMLFYKENTFAIKFEYRDMICDAFATFSPGANGKGQSIKMKGISPNIDFSFDFQDLDLQRVIK